MFRRQQLHNVNSKPTSGSFYNLLMHPLWVEDFLSVFPRGLIEEPYRLG